MRRPGTGLLGAGLLAALAAWTAPAAQTVEVDAARRGAAIPSTLFGVFYEDVNGAADGGLYAEYVKNRSFEFPHGFTGWTPFGAVSLRDDGPFPRAPHYARLADPGHWYRRTGLENAGFARGMRFGAGQAYHCSLWARCPAGGAADLLLELVDPRAMRDTQVLASARVAVKGADWRRYATVCTPDAAARGGRLRLTLRPAGARRDDRRTCATVDVEHVSVVPADTWRGEGVLRRDLAEAIAELRPGLFRFPGGCLVEGTTTETRYNWKDTVGPVENRRVNENLWSHSFKERLTPDYCQSGGLGYYELFRFAEQIGAEPFPVLSVGIPCQYRNDAAALTAKGRDLAAETAPYIQDALDLVAFANGPTNTAWGRVRAEMGHPAPFGMRFVSFGNEQWDEPDDPVFSARLALFQRAFAAQCPGVAVVGSSGPSVTGARFARMDARMRALGLAYTDEHFYGSYAFMQTSGLRFDGYDRSGPRIFAGEFATRDRAHGFRNHFGAAILEAAFRTTAVRNADLVATVLYAPTFVNAEAWQWLPGMVWFDDAQVYRTTSWWVQRLFAENRGRHVLPMTCGGRPLAGLEGQDGLFGCAAEAGADIVVTLVNPTAAAQEVRLAFAGAPDGFAAVARTRYAAADAQDENVPGATPVPPPARTPLDAATRTVALPPLCLDIYRFTRGASAGARVL